MVDEVKVPTKEMTLEAAQFEDPNVQLGDYVEDQIESIALTVLQCKLLAK